MRSIHVFGPADTPPPARPSLSGAPSTAPWWETPDQVLLDWVRSEEGRATIEAGRRALEPADPLDGWLAPEPPPVPTEHSVPVVDTLLQYLAESWEYGDHTVDVIATLETRRKQGLRRYGVPLYTHDGRRADRDIAQEIVDATIYHAKARIEEGHPLQGTCDPILYAIELGRRTGAVFP